MHFPFEQLQYGLFWSVLLATVLLCKFTSLTVPNFLLQVQIFCTDFPDFKLSAISIFRTLFDPVAFMIFTFFTCNFLPGQKVPRYFLAWLYDKPNYTAVWFGQSYAKVKLAGGILWPVTPATTCVHVTFYLIDVSTKLKLSVGLDFTLRYPHRP